MSSSHSKLKVGSSKSRINSSSFGLLNSTSHSQLRSKYGSRSNANNVSLQNPNHIIVDGVNVTPKPLLQPRKDIFTMNDVSSSTNIKNSTFFNSSSPGFPTSKSASNSGTSFSKRPSQDISAVGGNYNNKEQHLNQINEETSVNTLSTGGTSNKSKVPGIGAKSNANNSSSKNLTGRTQHTQRTGGGPITNTTRGLDSSTARFGTNKVGRGNKHAIDESALIEEIKLSETSTIPIFTLYSACLPTDNAFYESKKEQNVNYERKLAKKIECSDNFIQRHQQTMNANRLHKGADALVTSTKESGVYVTDFIIKDDLGVGKSSIDDEEEKLHEDGKENNEGMKDKENNSMIPVISGEVAPSIQSKIEEEMKLAMTSNGCLLDLSGFLVKKEKIKGKNSKNTGAREENGNSQNSFPSGIGSGKRNSFGTITNRSEDCGIGEDDIESAKKLLEEKERRSILNSKSLQNSLALTERCIQQSTYHLRQLCFRGLINTDEADNIITKKVLLWEDAYDMAEKKAKEEAEEEEEEDAYGVIGGNETSDNHNVEKPHKKERNSSNAGHSSSKKSKHKSKHGGSGTGESKCDEQDPTLDRIFEFSCNLGRGRSCNVLRWCPGTRFKSGLGSQSSDDGNSSIISGGTSEMSLKVKGSIDIVHRHNHTTKDLLGVGYGSGELNGTILEGGLLLIWSLRNPAYPEKVYRLPDPVISVAFSKYSPSVVAAGTESGVIYLFDLKKEEASSVMDTVTSPSRHRESVWQLEWVDKGGDIGENLVSISSDGRVVEWSIIPSQGIVGIELMELKRVGDLKGKISSIAHGLCFDFIKGDSTQYLVGSEDGIVHRCSVSYSEQYLEVYTGHTAPIYSLKSSPFAGNIFASASGDWSIKLWDTNHSGTNILSLQPTDLDAGVNSVSWSTISPTVLASVTGDGRVMLWDLAISSIDPVSTYQWNWIPRSAEYSVNNIASSRGGKKNRDDASVIDSIAEDSANKSIGEENDDASNSFTYGRDSADAFLPPSSSEYTCVEFLEGAPILVAGDAFGTVTCFRILNLGEDSSYGNSDGTEGVVKSGDTLLDVLYPVTAISAE